MKPIRKTNKQIIKDWQLDKLEGLGLGRIDMALDEAREDGMRTLEQETKKILSSKKAYADMEKIMIPHIQKAVNLTAQAIFKELDKIPTIRGLSNELYKLKDNANYQALKKKYGVK